jgi:hypothetical protein
VTGTHEDGEMTIQERAEEMAAKEAVEYFKVTAEEASSLRIKKAF